MTNQPERRFAPVAFSLIVTKDISFTHPKHPDAVFVLRLPLPAGALESVNTSEVTNEASMSLDMVANALVSWPVPEPITRETVRRLDLETYYWLVREVQKASNISDDEKKDSGSNSSPITDQDAEPSRTSSDS